MNDPRPLPQLSDYARHVRRYSRRIAALSIMGAVIGGIVFFSFPTRFHATSRVALSPQLTYVSLSPTPEKQPPVTLDTTAQLLRSDFAIEKIADAMDVTAQEARDSLVITAMPGSLVLVVQISADTREQARLGSKTANEALLELQSETFALSRDRVRELKKRVATLESQAQESLAEGLPSTSLFESVEIFDRRLDRAVGTNNSDSHVIMRATVVEYRPGDAEIDIVSGLAIGLILALISAGPAGPGRGSLRSQRRLRQLFVKLA